MPNPITMQQLEVLIRLGTLISVMVGVATLIVGAYRFKRQLNVQVFIEYTKRFDQVLSSFPAGAWCARTSSEADLPEESSELTMACLRYLNLCAEELYLRRRRYLKDRVWRIWEAELARTLSSRLFVREWRSLRAQFATYPEFQHWVESKMNHERSRAKK